MNVTVDNIATELARPTPPLGPQRDQWQSWIDRAYRMVQDRLGSAYDDLNQDTLNDVVLVAVAEHVRAWRDTTASQSTVSVDDGSVTRRYEASVGPLTIPDSLWALLDPTLTTSTGAFSVTPSFAPDTVAPESWA